MLKAESCQQRIEEQMKRMSCLHLVESHLFHPLTSAANECLQQNEIALGIIQLYRKLQKQREFVLSNQLLRSGTSIGANVEEASAGQSRKDFLAKMCIAAKEARETRYWLRLLQASQLVEVELNDELSHIDELIRILTSIIKTTRETL